MKKNAPDAGVDAGALMTVVGERPIAAAWFSPLGICGIVANCLCALLAIGLSVGAINMANADLSEMDRGRMDERGRGTTKAGQICGIVGVILGVINIILGIIIVMSKHQ
jgi:hypothetical protein